ncbi:hypothetical protein K502DRAFT_343576 [Neoconidiobolus thromboides FSU 785]|nr:hypothetical protein K502DRAFT_343576 [Neoconidiobolus thromboides FSU 785]
MDQLVLRSKPTGYQEDEDNQRPDKEVVNETAERTRLALEKITEGKIASTKPKNINTYDKKPIFFRYTPAQQGANLNSGARQRIVRVVEMPVDPLEPPKFRHKKVPNGPPSPPAPVLHSPTRKVTAKEQQDWVIPPCISNWKNSKGYTIPLDKRLAADGRGLQDVQINDKFAILSESLFSAERIVRDETRTRNMLLHKVAEKEKMQKEESLRNLAQKARESRAHLHADGSKQNEEVEDEELHAREELRREKQKEREREMRLSHMGAEQRAKFISRQENRDISEKVALGLAKPTLSKESMFDSRLFNQSEGISSGFKDDDTYDLYNKPLFTGSSANMIYKPKRNMEEDMEDAETQLDKIKNDDRFSGALGGRAAFKGADASVEPSGPVKFEKSNNYIDDEVDKLFGDKKEIKRGLDDRIFRSERNEYKRDRR